MWWRTAFLQENLGSFSPVVKYSDACALSGGEQQWLMQKCIPLEAELLKKLELETNQRKLENQFLKCVVSNKWPFW